MIFESTLSERSPCILNGYRFFDHSKHKFFKETKQQYEIKIMKWLQSMQMNEANIIYNIRIILYLKLFIHILWKLINLKL